MAEKKQERLRLRGLGPDHGGEGGYYLMKIRLRDGWGAEEAEVGCQTTVTDGWGEEGALSNLAATWGQLKGERLWL